ncbi:Uncharacterized protein HZ326_28280 [Fusarium oxysporum f. sp. albedinis]|nr:Uncharacterized protein HZ326_28280 [Fusarium oxysporum f. sp. albedinis]
MTDPPCRVGPTFQTVRSPDKIRTDPVLLTVHLDRRVDTTGPDGTDCILPTVLSTTFTPLAAAQLDAAIGLTLTKTRAISAASIAKEIPTGLVRSICNTSKRSP